MSDLTWPRQMRHAIVRARDLYRLGWIDQTTFENAEEISRGLQFRVPAIYATAMSPNNPLHLQFVPQARELVNEAYEKMDPIGDEAHTPIKGICHRYPDRVLFKPTLHCAVYCRFCFRRHKVAKSGWELTDRELQAAMQYIRDQPRIKEVILTGGDPLTLTDTRLSRLLHQLTSIDHIKIVRIHSKVLTALPSRISDPLISTISSIKKPVIMVWHINHQKELTVASDLALKSLVDAGIPCLQQGVLLKDVNDQIECLEQLYWSLIERKVIPYYLHYLDPAPGTGHFRIPLHQARQLMLDLRGRMPGYAIPRLMIDIPGGKGKVDALSPALWQDQDRWWALSPLDHQKYPLPSAYGPVV